MKSQGRFISIEGIEGAGKSTALRFLSEEIQKTHACIVTREPGGTPLAEEIRKTLLHPTVKEVMCWETELLLMFAARAQHLHALVKPALEEGRWVVSDRFVDASFAYQGGGRGIPVANIQLLNDWIVASTLPDLTFLLDIDPVLGLARAMGRGQGQDRIEQEKVDFFIRVREAYLARALAYPDRIKVIDASKSLAEVQTQLLKVLHDFTARLS